MLNLFIIENIHSAQISNLMQSEISCTSFVPSFNDKVNTLIDTGIRD